MGILKELVRVIGDGLTGGVQDDLEILKQYEAWRDKENILEIGSDISPQGMVYQELFNAHIAKRDEHFHPIKTPSGRREARMCHLVVTPQRLVPELFLEETVIPADSEQSVTIKLYGSNGTLREIRERIKNSSNLQLIKQWR